MRALIKASSLLVTGCVLAGALVACAPYEAYKPEDPNAEILKKLKLPENVSDELAELLVLSIQANQVAVFGDQVKDKEVSLQGYINLFNMTGHGAIQGVSSQKVFMGNSKEDGSGNDQYNIQVNVFARGAGLNRELKFIGSVKNDLEQRTAGFVELEMANDDDKIVEFVDCLKSPNIDQAFKDGLKQKEAYPIKAFAACFDKTCDTVVVQLQLKNTKDVMTDARVGFSFVDKVSSGNNKRDVPVPLTLTESSLPEVASYEDAEANKKVEKLKGDANYVQCLALSGRKGEEGGDDTGAEDLETASDYEQPLIPEGEDNPIPEMNSNSQPRQGEVEAAEDMFPEVQAGAIDEMINEAMNGGSEDVEEEQSVEGEDIVESFDSNAEEITEGSEESSQDDEEGIAEEQ